MTLQLDQICACHKKSHSNGSITATLSIIPLATKSDIATSPTLSRPRKVALQPPCNFTKSALAAKDHIAASANSAPATKKLHPNITATSPSWFAHHEQWHSCLVRIKHETSRSMRWASRVTLQHVHVQRIVQVQDLIAQSVNCFRHKEDESNLPGHNPRTIWGGSAQRAYLSFKRSKRLHWKLNLEII